MDEFYAVSVFLAQVDETFYEETTMEMTPDTFYSCASTLETYYVNQHGICFLIDAGECSWPDGYVHERIDELPADAREADPVSVAHCGIMVPPGIEEVTA